MKNILVVQSHFPPAAGSGVQRGFEFVRRLRDFGYEPIVITATEEDYKGFTSFHAPLDHSNIAKIPEGIEVYRVSSGWPMAVYTRLAKKLADWHLYYLVSLFVYPDSGIFWIWPVIRQVKRLVRDRKIDALFVTVPPFSLCILGWILKRLFRKPVIMDFRDPWAQNSYGWFPSRLTYRIVRIIERRILRDVDHLIYNTPTSRDNLLRANPDLPSAKVTCITNGYNDEDWIPVIGNNRASEDEPFTIVYAGVFYGTPELVGNRELPDGGMTSGSITVRLWRAMLRRVKNPLKLIADLRFIPPYICSEMNRRWSFKKCEFDTRTHSPEALLKAMRELFDEHPQTRNRIRLIHVGVPVSANEAYAKSLGLNGSFEARGYQSRDSAAEMVRNADALYICMADSTSNARLDAVGEKVYQYIASHRPILALVPEGDARDILKAAGTAVVCRPRDIAEIKSGILDLFEGRLKLQPNDNYIKQYSRRNLTARLAKVLDQVTSTA
ncbi:MAG: glycosyltransferase [Acidobacteria bacterium]|nr:glycosyltransferase [Acidobacteriota bacterium]MCW5970283.1 glycosyltransferase [Blastocatellales bacterium]